MPADSSNYPERFERTLALYGEDGFARIRRAAVIVVGQGGVGAHASVALARSGIGHLTLIDHDVLTASSLNRFPAAVGENQVGRPKVDLMREHLALSCPHTEVRVVQTFLDEDNAEALLSDEPDFVVDAIDSLEAKVQLLITCRRLKLPVVSSMGAAVKTDPTLVRIADISATTVCPLAAQVRRMLRKSGITSGIPCVHSLEKPDMRKVRRERLPSAISMPGIFGYALAGFVCDVLAGRRNLPPARP